MTKISMPCSKIRTVMTILCWHTCRKRKPQEIKRLVLKLNPRTRARYHILIGLVSRLVTDGMG
ncbi:hypothetical protein QZH41_015372, partial [Actinostola sp. cb2023]